MEALVDTSKAISWCATWRCRGSAGDVAALLAARFTDDPTVMTAAGRLTVIPRASSRVATVGPMRTHHAKLSFGAWRPATKVTIEVEPWSRAASELLVRPSRRPPLMEDAYFASVLAVLETLAAEIDATLTPMSEIAPSRRLRRAS